jgi:hypothetical protein
MAKKATRGGKRPGAGRPTNPEGPAVTVAVSVPEPLVRELNELAEQKGWSRSEAVTNAIRKLLGKRSPKG